MNPEQRIYNAWSILVVTFGALFVIAGLDKFLNLIVNWEAYVAFQSLVGNASFFMRVVGVFEILVGIFMFTRWTQIAAYVASAWLVIIALNLVLGGFYDIAVRDIVMAIGAFVLGYITPIIKSY